MRPNSHPSHISKQAEVHHSEHTVHNSECSRHCDLPKCRCEVKTNRPRKDLYVGPLAQGAQSAALDFAGFVGTLRSPSAPCWICSTDKGLSIILTNQCRGWRSDLWKLLLLLPLFPRRGRRTRGEQHLLVSLCTKQSAERGTDSGAGCSFFLFCVPWSLPRAVVSCRVECPLSTAVGCSSHFPPN